jgi:hypothetical protein
MVSAGCSGAGWDWPKFLARPTRQKNRDTTNIRRISYSSLETTLLKNAIITEICGLSECLPRGDTG